VPGEITDPVAFFVPVAAVLQMVFTAFAAVDALYFHAWHYKLHARADTRSEHLLHTANACLFPFTVWFLFCTNAGGAFLWVGVAAIVATYAVEFTDVALERRTRVAFGGLGAVEGVMHFGMGVLRALAFAFVLAGKPVEAFLLSSPNVLPVAYPDWVLWMGRVMFGAAVPMALMHIGLLISGARSATSQHTVAEPRRPVRGIL